MARRTIIQNAVRIINPLPIQEHAPSSFGRGGTTMSVEQAETAAILQLEPFDRFIYVMSGLEHYSDLNRKRKLEIAFQSSRCASLGPRPYQRDTRSVRSPKDDWLPSCWPVIRPRLPTASGT